MQDERRSATEATTALGAKLSAHETTADLRLTKLDSQQSEATQRLSLQIVEAQEGLARRVDEAQVSNPHLIRTLSVPDNHKPHLILA